MSNMVLYIVSFLDNDPMKRYKRLAIHNEQIDWFLKHTDMDIRVVAMQYRESDYLDHHYPRVTYIVRQPLPVAAARKVAFESFYNTHYEWMVMADNDSTLYDDVQHNSGANFFNEMSAQIDKYRALGIIYPINPQKYGFNAIYEKDPVLYRDNHVFKRGMDLKGSMYLVRNFRKHGQTEIWPDLDYNWCEENKLSFDAIAAGHLVMRCENIILKERGLTASSFGDATVDRKPFMQEANERIAAAHGMTMRSDKPHLINHKAFVKRCWKGPEQIVIPKTQEIANRLDEFNMFA